MHSCQNSYACLLVCLAFLLCLSGCSPAPFFEQYKDVPKFEWTYEYVPEYEVTINDTAATYDIYVALRHNNNYPYSNLYVKLFTKFPSSDKFEAQMVELPLADQEGRWHGEGTGDIVRQVISIQQNASLPEIGNYEFKIAQHMRKDPLEEVMAVGLLIEKR